MANLSDSSMEFIRETLGYESPDLKLMNVAIAYKKSVDYSDKVLKLINDCETKWDKFNSEKKAEYGGSVEAYIQSRLEMLKAAS